MTDRTWRGEARTATPRDLPRRADVLIVGGGLAGCAIAALLAEDGVDCLLLERREDLGLGGSGRAAGGALPGLADAPSRLVEALGDATARALLDATAWNLDLLEDHGLMERCGALFPAMGALEAEELAASLALHAAWGDPVDGWSAEEVAARTGATGFGGGRFDPRGGRVRPRAAILALAERARAAGAALCTGVEVLRVTDAGDDNRVVALAQPQSGVGEAILVEVRASVVIYAGDHRLGGIDSFFLDKVHGVRLQQQRRASAIGLRAPTFPISTQFSYAWACASEAGGLITGGCRWATPHLEVMETDEEVQNPLVDAKITSVVAGRWPGWAEAPVVERWSLIATFTCDGLPLVGPLPGRATEHALCGWNGRPWSWAMAAATDLAERLLRGGPSRLPAQLAPSRFL
jgi:glycine/D-amino acid oxidase-like deaminating enzyme